MDYIETCEFNEVKEKKLKRGKKNKIIDIFLLQIDLLSQFRTICKTGVTRLDYG